MSTPMWDLPEHQLIPADEKGRGPVDETEATQCICWCPKGADCQEVRKRP